MDHRDLNRVGRCCARCASPYMCSRALCPCHGDSDAVCSFPGCGERLYVPPPRAPSFRTVFADRRAA